MAQLQSMMGMAGPTQAQPGTMVHPNQQQQQALLAQQQKQGMLGQMGGVMRAQQPGAVGQRPGFPPGAFRGQVNLQAIIAQNPQLRHLPPNQQIQHIQAMLAQRQLQQGQMLRMCAGQGPGPGQVRPQGPRMQGLEGQQLHHGAAGLPQQQSMMAHPSGASPQSQQGMMVQSPGPQHQMGQQGASPQALQQMARAQPGLTLGQVRVTPQGRVIRSMSPRQPFGQSSPGDPAFAQQRHSLPHPGGVRQPSPTQAPQQPPTPTGSSPFHPSHTPVGSPAGLARPSSSDSGLFPPTVQKKEHGASACQGADPRTPTRPPATSPPSKTNPLGPSRSPGGGGPAGQPGLEAKTQAPERCGAGQANGPSQPPAGPAGEALSAVTLQNIKQEPREEQCAAGGGDEAQHGAVKREAGGEPTAPPGNAGGSPHGPRAETGQQLLQKLLRTKNLQLAGQRPSEGVHSEINGHINSKLALLEQKLQGTPRNMEVRDSHGSYSRPPVGGATFSVALYLFPSGT